MNDEERLILIKDYTKDIMFLQSKLSALLSSEKRVIDAVLLQVMIDYHHMSPYYQYTQRSRCIHAINLLIDHASQKGIDDFWVLLHNIYPKENDWQIGYGYRHDNYQILKKVIHRASPDGINHALIVKRGHDMEGLRRLIQQHGHDDLVEEVMKKASSEIIDQFLVSGEYYDQNGLMEVMNTHPKCVECVLSKASKTAIDQAILLQNRQGETAFFLSVLPPRFSILVKKSSPAALHQAFNLEARVQIYPSTSKIRTGFYQAMIRANEKDFKELVDKVPPISIYTAILNSRHHRHFQEAKPQNLAIVRAKAPFALDVLSNPKSIETQPDKLIALYKEVFNDQLDSKIMTLEDCNLWLSFSNKALEYASSDEAKNVIRAGCVQLCWIAAEKARQLNRNKKDINDKNEALKYGETIFREEALKYANELTSAAGLSINQNLLIYDLYQMQEKHMSCSAFKFLHEAAVQANDRTDIEHSPCAHLSVLVNSLIDPGKEIDLNKKDWTDKDEENYKKAIPYLEAYELAQIEKLQHMQKSEKYFEAIENIASSFDAKANNDMTALILSLREDLATARKDIKEAKDSDSIISTLTQFKTKYLDKLNPILTSELKMEVQNQSVSNDRFSLKKLCDAIKRVPMIQAGISYVLTKWSKRRGGCMFFSNTAEQTKRLYDAFNQDVLSESKNPKR